MSPSTLRKLIAAFLLLLVPVSWLATKYQPYQMDGDSVAYMDLVDLIRTHQWAGVVNAYWHPLYPAMLRLAQAIVQPARATELRAYLGMNEAIFLTSVAAMLFFVSALVRLRTQMLPADDQTAAPPVVGAGALSLLGVGLVVIAAQRELSTGLVKPDALLETLMLLAFACLLRALVSSNVAWPLLTGLCFGLAYLTKSFAFVVALGGIAIMMAALRWLRGRSWTRVMVSGSLALLVFAAVAGPYVAALSEQKGRLDFGDSGALNYAWYVSGTDKMHLEPWMQGHFGSAAVALKHPEQQLLVEPGVYSYKAESYGTYPDWFDTSYFNERIVPHFNARLLLRRDARNALLVLRYSLNHPEAWILLALLVLLGARWRVSLREGFWLPMVLLGLLMWGLYGLVNVEERYVTLAYLVLLLPVFANLRASATPDRPWLRSMATILAVLLACLALGETLRTALENRRTKAAAPPAVYGAAAALTAMGIRPGDEVACMGTTACVHDPYWARLAGVRVLTEVYQPDAAHLMLQWQSLPNRDRVVSVLKAEGAKILVANFDPGEVTSAELAAGWQRLGETNFYALPINFIMPPTAAPQRRWTTDMRVAP